MQHKNAGVLGNSEASQFSYVYSYLLVGIALVVAAIVFLPRVAVG